MRHSFPGFGCVISGLALLTNACGASSPGLKMQLPEAAAELPGAPALPRTRAAESSGSSNQAAAGAASPAPQGLPPAGAGHPVAAPAVTAAMAPAKAREMLDIEAHLTLQVAKVRDAVARLHELATASGGVVTQERVDGGVESGSAELTLRIPSEAADSAFDELEQLGNLLQRNVTARDIGKEYFDANGRLASLEATERRYQEILTHATSVEEILRIEAELARIREQIEQVKGNLRWLSDRAARATLHISLHERALEIVKEPKPEPKFYPGLRALGVLDVGKSRTDQYWGGGAALRFSRALSLDLDVLERSGGTSRGPDAVLATIGGEIYSELLGGGDRRYLNPYLGWRLGYARFQSDDQALVGVTLGLELYKNRWFGLDAEARNLLTFAGERGSHYLLSPALSARVAF